MPAGRKGRPNAADGAFLGEGRESWGWIATRDWEWSDPKLGDVFSSCPHSGHLGSPGNCHWRRLRPGMQEMLPHPLPWEWLSFPTSPLLGFPEVSGPPTPNPRTQILSPKWLQWHLLDFSLLPNYRDLFLLPLGACSKTHSAQQKAFTDLGTCCGFSYYLLFAGSHLIIKQELQILSFQVP